MDLKKILTAFPNLTGVVAAVTEIADTAPYKEFEVIITGTNDSVAVKVIYNVIKEGNLNVVQEATAREDRYSDLLGQTSKEKTISTDVAAQIEVLDPTPTP